MDTSLLDGYKYLFLKNLSPSFSFRFFRQINPGFVSELFKNNYDGLAGEVINFGTGKETTIRDIAEYVAKKLNTRIEYRKPRPGEVKSFVAADTTKALSLGFEPKVLVWEGIDRYIEWRENNG